MNYCNYLIYAHETPNKNIFNSICTVSAQLVLCIVCADSKMIQVVNILTGMPGGGCEFGGGRNAGLTWGEGG